MCGIVGMIGREPVTPRMVDALRRMEYRGYDSAGVATLEAGQLSRRRAKGKLLNLERCLARRPLEGKIGIGHTRWATHGRASEANAHPHATDCVAVVHNGIIENFHELRRDLENAGAVVSTDTDSEIVAHLVTAGIKAGRDPVAAVRSALPNLRGSFALVFLFSGEENLLIGARRGSPLAIGYGKGEMYLGSDAIALAPLTDAISYLEDGDWVVIRRGGAEVHDATGATVSRVVVRSDASAYRVDKAEHRHFMAKEIHEQPDAIARTLERHIDKESGRVVLPEEMTFDLRALKRVSIAACGTAYHAGLIARHWFERFARLPVDIDVASEFRYREAPFEPGDLALFVSQSGETADTLATLRHAKEERQHILSIVNVPTSTIARESDVLMPTLAGPEVGVASTKAFTCQLAVLVCLAVGVGRARGMLDEAQERQLVRDLMDVPRLVAEALTLEPEIRALARDFAKKRDVLYLGRGTSFPLALEGALKLKEISYIHAEGYAAGELKHGPIALVDENIPVVVIAPSDHTFEKTVSNMQEVSARGGRIILLADARGCREASIPSATAITMPEMPTSITPLVYSIPLQLIAYHTAAVMGTDVDQPRNLAKSVTVE